MYCDHCKLLTAETTCPACGSRALREPQEDDSCFLTEKEMLWGEMLADLLRQNQIPFLYKKALGAGLAMEVGPYQERYAFYVPYAHLPAAKEIVAGFFSPQNEA